MTMFDELIEMVEKFREEHKPIATRIDMNQKTFDWLSERIEHVPPDNPFTAHALGGVPVEIVRFVPNGYGLVFMSDGSVKSIRFTDKTDGEEEAQA